MTQDVMQMDGDAREMMLIHAPEEMRCQEGRWMKDDTRRMERAIPNEEMTHLSDTQTMERDATKMEGYHDNGPISDDTS